MIPFGANDIRFLKQKSQIITKGGEQFQRFELDMTMVCLCCYEIYNRGKVMTLDIPDNSRYSYYYRLDFENGNRCPSCNCSERTLIHCDNLIVNSIINLNKNNFKTNCCCSGHTGTSLDDSTFLIYPTYIVFPVNERKYTLINMYESNRANIKDHFDLLYKFGSDNGKFHNGYDAILGDVYVLISKDYDTKSNIKHTNYSELVDRMFSSDKFITSKDMTMADNLIKKRCSVLNEFVLKLIGGKKNGI